MVSSKIVVIERRAKARPTPCQVFAPQVSGRDSPLGRRIRKKLEECCNLPKILLSSRTRKAEDMHQNASNRILSILLNGVLAVVLERPKLTFTRGPGKLLILAGSISFLLARSATARVRPESLETEAAPAATQTTADEATRKRIEELIAQLRKPLGSRQSPAHDPAIAELVGIGRPAVQSLITALEDENLGVRLSSVRALGRIGDRQAVPALIKALEVGYVRESAIDALGEIGDPRAVGPLIKLLSERSSSIRESAKKALGKIGQPAIQVFIDNASSNEDPRAREYAAGILGEIGGSAAVQPLVKALSDEDSRVRISAARTLGQIGDPNAAKALSDALEDESRDVRKSAAEALGKIGDPQAVQPLIKAASDGNDNVRISAAIALGQIGAPQAVPPLVNMLSDRNSSVVTSAVGALGEIADPRAIQPLIKAVGDRGVGGRHGGFRRAAIDALPKMGQPAVRPLIEALADKRQHVRTAAAMMLGEIGDPQAVEALIKALEDEDWIVRDFAVRALGKIGDPRAVEALIQALDDKKGPVSASAASALRKIDDPQAAKAVRKRALARNAKAALPIVIGLLAVSSPALLIVGVIVLVRKSRRKSVVQIQQFQRQNVVHVREPQPENAALIQKRTQKNSRAEPRPIRATLIYFALAMGNSLGPPICVLCGFVLSELIGLLGVYWLGVTSAAFFVLVCEGPNPELASYFFITLVYFHVFFIPLLGALCSRGATARRRWKLVQVTFIVCHLAVYFVLITQYNLLNRMAKCMRY